MTIHLPPLADPRARVEAKAILLDFVMAEVRAAASTAQERGFLLAIGRRIAASFPLDDLAELGALTVAINRVLCLLGAGAAHLSADVDGIRIEHREQPGTGDPGAADGFDPVVLEGLYAGWFASFGSDRLALKRLAAAPGTLIFHYGR